MKRMGCLLLILSCLISICSCKKTIEEDYIGSSSAKNPAESQPIPPEEEKASQQDMPKTITGTYLDLVPGAQPPMVFLSTEETEQGQVIHYQDQDWSGMPEYTNSLAVTVGWPQCWSEIKNAMGEDGLIVAGSAYGIREGYCDKGYTLTNFNIQKVYYGNELNSVIKIQEQFIASSRDNRNYIYSVTGSHTLLKDHQLVVLFLAKSNELKNEYIPVWYEFPLPADYQTYNESYLTNFLDFYRGNRSAYEYSEMEIVQKEKKNPDGTVELLEEIYGGNYWPEREISNEALIEEMSEHILVRLVTEYQIKIWPYGHKEYAANGLPENAAGLKILSYPPKNQ